MQGDNTQFWVTIGSIVSAASLFLVFLFDILRRIFSSRFDKKAEEEKAAQAEARRMAEKKERDDIAERFRAEQREVEERIKKELERNAIIVKQELELHYDREKLELEKTAFALVSKLNQQEVIVKTLDTKIVTLVKADEHKTELKEAINESILVGKESTIAAKEAFEVANTINLKLEKMSEAGKLNQKQEEVRKEIDVVEDKVAEDKAEDKKE